MIGILLTIIAVPVILNIITDSNAKSNTNSLTYFCMRPPKGIAIVGFVLVFFLGAITLLTFGNGRFHILEKMMLVTLLSLGVLLMLLPVKGFWDITVVNDEVISSRLWIIKRSVQISDITFCTKDQRGILVYTDGKTKPVLSIESLNTNVKNFEKRMINERIEIKSETSASNQK